MIKNYWTKHLLTTSLTVFTLLFYLPSHSQIIQWDNCGKFLGNISQGSNNSDWTQYWNQVTPENGGKWGSVERERDVMNWTDLDKAYKLAKDNGLLFKQHVFAWGNQQPSWIETLTEEEQLAEIEEWIMAYCERYPDTDFIEVVNEPINDPPFGSTNGNYANALGGRGDTGYDWIIKAFELAKEHCPNAALMINEYNLLNSENNRYDYSKIIGLLTERELIDAVGAQGHAFTVKDMTAEDMTTAINDLAKHGLPVYITELDIDGPGENTQLEKYKEIFPAIWEHPSVAGVTLWGYRQGTMWREDAYIMNSNGTERSALTWLKDYITPYNSVCEGYDPPLNTGFNTKATLIYPNPISNGSLHVQSDKAIEKLTIRNISGQKMLEYRPHQLTQKIELEIDLPAGLYLVKIEGPSLSEERRLVIK
ncbi:endo-1,4-beta-xylanase [Reichenbachiella ulvae]|uniref:endo-1,4-beta-xylanase n=1 Tax=Reichenbachiella ulvae TaxID=2980104 RepID=A0ABT3CSL6_9BACT|nr:endo-1,4-beta-xylanase [Reichenbachiella ulvae]MCV9386602.1 endo-1,4-beta-xylanase [Reichenbachiella ulvae]